MAFCNHVLLFALALPMMAVLCPAAKTTPTAAVALAGTIESTRTGNEALLTWRIPDGEFIRTEIFRNTNISTAGRGRVNVERTDVTHLPDQIPDLNVKYRYWIKLSRANGAHVNVGPAATPWAMAGSRDSA
jgi:hypothetical protein